MREKSQNQTFAGAIRSALEQFFNDFFMSNVNPVKSAQSHNGFSGVFKIGYGLKNGQQIWFVWSKFSVIITYKKHLRRKTMLLQFNFFNSFYSLKRIYESHA